MSFTSDFKQNIDPAIDAALADTVTYVKPGHGSETVDGYLENDHLEGFEVSSYEPTFECPMSAISNPARGDQIIFENITHEVTEVHKNEPYNGRLTLILKI